MERWCLLGLENHAKWNFLACRTNYPIWVSTTQQHAWLDQYSNVQWKQMRLHIRSHFLVFVVVAVLPLHAIEWQIKRKPWFLACSWMLRLIWSEFVVGRTFRCTWPQSSWANIDSDGCQLDDLPPPMKTRLEAKFEWRMNNEWTSMLVHDSGQSWLRITPKQNVLLPSSLLQWTKQSNFASKTKVPFCCTLPREKWREKVVLSPTSERVPSTCCAIQDEDDDDKDGDKIGRKKRWRRAILCSIKRNHLALPPPYLLFVVSGVKWKMKVVFSSPIDDEREHAVKLNWKSVQDEEVVDKQPLLCQINYNGNTDRSGTRRQLEPDKKIYFPVFWQLKKKRKRTKTKQKKNLIKLWQANPIHSILPRSLDSIWQFRQDWLVLNQVFFLVFPLKKCSEILKPEKMLDFFTFCHAEKVNY